LSWPGLTGWPAFAGHDSFDFDGARTMSLQLITPPAIEPVTLAEAKAHLKVDTADDDALIAAQIAAARASAEWHLGRALITQSWIQWRDCWPADGIIELSLPPLQSVASVTTYARDNTPTMPDPGTYP